MGMKTLGLALATTAALMLPAQAEDALSDAVIDYMDFATYEQGIILPAQIDEDVFNKATFIDTRDAGQFKAGHIKGAANIEWRQVPARLDELPDSGLVILYCNTGSLSAQAVFAARLMGRENVVVLQSGLIGWTADAAFHPD